MAKFLMAFCWLEPKTIVLNEFDPMRLKSVSNRSQFACLHVDRPVGFFGALNCRVRNLGQCG